MKKLYAVLVVMALSASCATGVRYSPEEIRSYPPKVQESIKAGAVTLGMTQQQVRYTWGMPGEVNVLDPTRKGEFREEWIYRKAGIFMTILIFIDRELTEIISTGLGVGNIKVGR